MRSHEFLYTPIVVGAQQRYNIDLPADASPVRFWTITSDMQSWLGEVTKVSPGHAWAAVEHYGRLVTVNGQMSSLVKPGMPCYVMEHLNVDGEMGYLIGALHLQDGNKNFINYGIPGGKHIRIDIYTGESRIING